MADSETKPQEAPQEQPKTFKEEDVNRIVQDRLARERQKYSDYDELVKFKTEHQKQLEAQTQKELEEQKKYEEILKKKDEDFKKIQEALTQKDQMIQQKDIDNALTTEIFKQNAYPETRDLLKNQAVVEDGQVKVRFKDNNGIDTLLSVEEGVKRFLESKPYLAKAEARKGGGTGPSNTPGEQGDRNLAEELQAAMRSGDRKKAMEIKQAIRNKHSSMSGQSGGFTILSR